MRNEYHPTREVYLYGTNDAEVRDVHADWRGTILDVEDMDSLE